MTTTTAHPGASATTATSDDATPAATPMDRRRFVSALLDQVPDALVVTGLGSASYDVFAHGEREENFYLWGAMGGSVPVGLGLALAQPERSVLVVTGDGEMLMGIGSLGSAAVQAPENLTVLVLDNGHFGETGMQRSHSGLGVRLVDVARSFGIADCHEVHSIDQVADVASTINARNGLSFVQAHINTDEPPRALPPRDGVAVKNKFRAALGLGTF